MKWDGKKFEWINMIAGWLFLTLAPVAMVIGHLGTQQLSWTKNQISTFAATAPNDGWVTSSMCLMALALLCISVLVSRHERWNQTLSGNLFVVLAGAVICGLLLIATFEETAANLPMLRRLGFNAVRQQSFHDAGLLVFFHGAILALVTAGIMIVGERNPGAWALGAVVAASGPLSYAAMTTSWPATIGIAGVSTGLKQRAAFLLLWLGTLLILTAASRRRVE